MKLNRLLSVCAVFLFSILCMGQKFEKIEKKGKFGIRNTETNKIVLKPKYSWIGDVNQPFTIVKSYDKIAKKELSGLLCGGEALILDCKYDTISMPRKYADGIVRVFVKKNDKKFLYEIKTYPLNLFLDKPIDYFDVTKNGTKFVKYELKPGTWVWKIEDKTGKVLFDYISNATQLGENTLLLHDANRNRYVLVNGEGTVIGEKSDNNGYTKRKPDGFYTDKIAVIGNKLIHLLNHDEYFYKAYIIDADGKEKYGIVHGIYGYIERYGPEIVQIIPFEYDSLDLQSRKLEHFGKGAVKLRDFDILSLNTDCEIPDSYLSELSNKRGWVEATVNGQNRKLFNDGSKLNAADDPEAVPETIEINDWVIFTENNKKGLRTKSGNILLPAVYTQISVTPEGKNLYKDVSVFNGLFYLFIDENRGIYNAPRKKIIVPVRDWERIVSDYSFNGFEVFAKDGSVFYFLLNGVKINGPFEESVRVLDKGTAVKKNGKWGFINSNGQQVIPCKYKNFDGDAIGWSSKLIFYFSNGADITYYIYDYNGRMVASQSFKSYQYRAKKDFILRYCN